MRTLLRSLGLAWALALSAVSAQAITTFGAEQEVNGTVTGSGTTVTFDFSTVPFAAWIDFTTTNLFDLELTSLTGPYSSSAVSGVVLFSDPAGTNTRLSGPTNCGSAAIGLLVGACTLINTAGLTFSDLAAGTYRLGFIENSGGPSNGTAVFNISEVPLPAGAALLLTALGGMAFLRRKQAA